MEFILHGTGTSSSVPNVSCLTSTSHPPCPTCTSTFRPEGKRNIRRNTGAFFKLRDSPDVVVIDAGKTFLQSSWELFPRYKLRKIAAVILTHAHADAMNGLDDLRGWTLRGVIQDHIDIYLSRPTFDEVQKSFPYLVSKAFATGGGDVPEFRYHFFEDGVPFTINDLYTITPLAVHHGRYFGTLPPVYLPHSAETSAEPTPPHTPKDPLSTKATIVKHNNPSLTIPHLNGIAPEAEPAIIPYVAYGFIIASPSHTQGSIIYISDASNIPDSTWETILHPPPSQSMPDIPSLSISSSPQSKTETKAPCPSLLIVDCLRTLPHSSHFGLVQALSTALRIFPNSSPSPTADADSCQFRAYLTGFSHEMTHKEWELVCETLSSSSSTTTNNNNNNKRTSVGGLKGVKWAPDLRQHLVEGAVKEGMKAFDKTGKKNERDCRVWIRPGYDGMRVVIQKDGSVVDADVDMGV